MASKITMCKVDLDADATRIVETVAAMLTAQGQVANIDHIVSNAVRVAYGDQVRDLVKVAAPIPIVA